MKIRERKNGLIKNHITGNIYSTTGWIKAFIPFVHVAIAQKHTPYGPKSKLFRVIWTKMGPTRTSKHSKKGVIRLFIEQGGQWCRVLEKLGWGAIYKICGG
jgi:hypothetical protein